MGKKYIIELERGETAYKTVNSNGTPLIQLLAPTPYTEPDMEQVQKEAFEKGYSTAVAEQECAVREAAEKGYQKGSSDAWEAARNVYLPEDHGGLGYKTRMKVFDTDNIGWIFKNLSASEAIEKIRAYEEKKETEEAKKETEIKVEDVMRQYLDIFCNSHRCNKCPLHTPEFTCGRGKHFFSLPHERVSDEEVRRAYAKVMKENE